MRKSNQRLPAWLAGIAVLVGTAGVANASTNDPAATNNIGGASVVDTPDCSSATDRTPERCDPEQTAQSPADERDGSNAGFDDESAANDVDDRASGGESQSGPDRMAQHSPDETPETRVVPPAYATPPAQGMPDSSGTASSTGAGQNWGESTSGSQQDLGERQNGTHVARAHGPASSNVEEDADDVSDEDSYETASGQDDESDRTESTASDYDEQPTRSVPPEHATRMPEENDTWSSSGTASSERDFENHDSAGYSKADESNQHSEANQAYADEDEEEGTSYPSGIARVRDQFDELDRNGDGMIDAAEAGVSTTLRAQFFTLDRNGDGKISISEFKGASDIASIRADRHERRQ